MGHVCGYCWCSGGTVEVWDQHKSETLARETERTCGDIICLVLSWMSGHECELTCCSLSSDSVTFVLKDKSCAKASECGITGQKRAAGLVFTYTTHCCDTDLCNAVAPLSAPYWRRTALSLCGTVLAVLLASVWTPTHATYLLYIPSLTASMVQTLCNWQERSRTWRNMFWF